MQLKRDCERIYRKYSSLAEKLHRGCGGLPLTTVQAETAFVVGNHARTVFVFPASETPSLVDVSEPDTGRGNRDHGSGYTAAIESDSCRLLMIEDHDSGA